MFICWAWVCSKVLEVAVHAQEYLEMPVRRSDDEALQRLFTAVRSELGLDPKNLKQEQAKFWKKQHPALIKASPATSEQHPHRTCSSCYAGSQPCNCVV